MKNEFWSLGNKLIGTKRINRNTVLVKIKNYKGVYETEVHWRDNIRGFEYSLLEAALSVFRSKGFGFAG